MSKLSRNKGKAYENRVASLFRLCGWLEAKRHLEYQYQEAEETRDLDGTFPFAVQCKNWKKAPPISTLEEIGETDEYPVRLAVLKRSRGGGKGALEVAVVDLAVFMEMIATLKEHDLLHCIYKENDL